MMIQNSNCNSHVTFRVFGLILSWCVLTAQVPYEYFQLQSVTPPPVEGVSLKARFAPRMPDKFYLDANTQKAGDLTLSEPFAPPVGVYKRREVFSQIQLKDGTMRIVPDTQACQPYALQPSDDKSKTLHRSALVWLEMEAKTYVILPSDSPEMIISDIRVELEGNQTAERQPKFSLWRCADDRYAVTVDVSGIYRITYETAAFSDSARPKDANFFRKAPKPSQTLLSSQIDPIVQNLIRDNRQLMRIRQSRAVLSELIRYFQGFQSQALESHDSKYSISSQLLKDLLDEKKGLCRHRTFLFMLIARAWGYSVRIAANEIHAFAEIHYKGRWYSIELGGDARSLTISPTTPTGKSQVQTDFDFLHTDKEIQGFEGSSNRDVLDDMRVGMGGKTRSRSSVDISSSSSDVEVRESHREYRFIPEEGFPLRMMRDSRVIILGQMVDEGLNPLQRAGFALELQHFESGRRLSIPCMTDEAGRIRVEVFVPPDWPAGASNISWHLE